jgi:hypothetical protein
LCSALTEDSENTSSWMAVTDTCGFACLAASFFERESEEWEKRGEAVGEGADLHVELKANSSEMIVFRLCP